MKQRVRKIERILRVQQHLQREAELKLSNLERESQEIRSTQEVLIHTMNDHETLHGLFVDVAAKRLQALSVQASRVDTAKTAQRAVTLDKAMQAKRTEKMLSGVKDDERQQSEKKSLVAILESLAGRDGTSFP